MSGELQNILLVEDEADIQAVAKMALESIGGFSVEVANSGIEALEVLKGHNTPDLMLLDVMMPGMDGPTTFEEVRKIDHLKDIPIIFMTAKVMESDKEQYKSLGAAGVIAKPFDPMTLADQIRGLWAEHG